MTFNHINNQISILSVMLIMTYPKVVSVFFNWEKYIIIHTA